MNMAGESVTYRQLWAEQLTFNEMRTNNTETDLVLWLDKQVRHTGLTQVQLRAYLVKLVGYLLHERKLTLTALIRSQFQLRQAVRNEIERLFELARSEAFQSDLFGKMTVAPQPETWQQFEFKAGIYPVRKPYRGSYEFGKHFYQQIDDLREKTKDGKNAEEFSCAQVIDMHPRVKHWVRNISQQRETSFWFPTAKDYFYPDFVCELDDGSIAVIEYKGEVYVSNDDSKEKEAIGKQWANNSQGKRIFLMARSKADDGRDVYQQIHDALAK